MPPVVTCDTVGRKSAAGREKPSRRGGTGSTCQLEDMSHLNTH